MVAYYKVDVMVGVEIQILATMQMRHSMIFMMSARNTKIRMRNNTQSGIRRYGGETYYGETVEGVVIKYYD